MANKKKQFDQEFKQNAVNYCLTHPELSRKECAKNLGIGDSTLYRWKQEAKTNWLSGYAENGLGVRLPLPRITSIFSTSSIL